MRQQSQLVADFDIAGVICRVESQRDDFWSLLSPRYAEFRSTDAPTVSIKVTLVDPPDDDVVAAWTGPFARVGGHHGRLTVDGAGFHGVFPEREGEGWITQPPDPAPFETFLTAICARRLLDDGGFILHAAALVAPEGARVFFGPSGSGKTTVSELIGEGVITDEISVIRRVGSRYRVSGVPWRGSRLESDLATLCALHHASDTTFTRLAPAEAVRRLLGSVFFARADAGEMMRFLATAHDVLRDVPCLEMRFTRDRSFWDAVPRPDRGGDRWSRTTTD
jgi:hypothetical protein